MSPAIWTEVQGNEERNKLRMGKALCICALTRTHAGEQPLIGKSNKKQQQQQEKKGKKKVSINYNPLSLLSFRQTVSALP